MLENRNLTDILPIIPQTDLHLDEEEIDFKDYLMESAGKGRLTSQDATFTLSNAPASSFASKLALKRRSLAHIFDEDSSSSSSSSDNEKRDRMRSNSVGCTPAPAIPAIPANYAGGAEANARPAIKKRFSVSRLLSSGKESAALLTAPSARRSSKSSPSSSRPTSAYGASE